MFWLRDPDGNSLIVVQPNDRSAHRSTRAGVCRPGRGVARGPPLRSALATRNPKGIRTPPAYTSAVAVYADLVRYRELFANLFRRDFQAKYRGSVLGLVWSLVNPLALMAVYLVVFGLLWQGNSIPYYPLYLLAGLACWTFFATSLQTGARSLVDSADLVKKVRFPRQLVAFSVVATQLVTFAAMLAILIVLSLAFVPDARPYVLLSIPLSVLFLGSSRAWR